MRRAVLLGLSGIVAVAALVSLQAREAVAIKSFKDQFEAKYVKPESKDAKEKAFAEAVEKAKCNVCHEGKTKKERNVYGTALSVLLDKTDDKENKEKIQKSMVIVEFIKSDPADKKSPTFGELIKHGKLPGGEPKEEKEEEK